MSAKNWHEERDRLVQLLEGIESGKITHIDENDLQQLQGDEPGECCPAERATCEVERSPRR